MTKSIKNSDKFFVLKAIGIVLIIVFLKSVFFDESEESINKNFNEYNYSDWKKFADLKVNDFYNCAKDLDYSTNNKYESCARYYRNDWVRYRDALENKANLSYDDIKKLKDYWQNKSDEIVKKISKKIDENERKRRPNKY